MTKTRSTRESSGLSKKINTTQYTMGSNEIKGFIFRDHAQALVKMGYFVFPLRGKSVHLLQNGCKGASRDLKFVAEWAANYPDANIGIKCGNLLVLDLDTGNGKNGVQDIIDIAEELGGYPDGPESMTGSGGTHLFFKRPAVDVIGSVGVKWKGRKTGIDIRVGDQYIVAPPSIHPNGNTYQWIKPIAPVEDLPELPQSWIDRFLPTRGKQTPQAVFQPGLFSSDDKTVERCRSYVAKVDPSIENEGGDTQLYKAACLIFWDFCMSETEGMPILQEFNTRCNPPWPQSRLDYKMQQALLPEGKIHVRGNKLNADSQGTSWSQYHHGQKQANGTEPEQTEQEKTNGSIPHSSVAERWHINLTDDKQPIRYLVANDDDDMNYLSLEPEAITAIGAPPGMGKSALVNQIFFEALYRNDGINALIANVEQSSRVLLNRELARVSDLPYDLIRHKRLNEIRCRERLDDGIEIIKRLGNRLNWMQFPMTIERIVEETRRVDASVILVDYIQKIATKAAVSSDHERIEAVMSQLIELKNEGRSIIVVSALSRQTTKNGSYTNSDIGSFRGSSDLEFSSTNAFIMKRPEGQERFNRFLQCLKMKEDERISLKMNFRGSRMSFEVVGTVSSDDGDDDRERPNEGETAPDYSNWSAGGEEETEHDEAEVGFAV